MEGSTGVQGLQALYTQIDPVKMIRSLVDKAKSKSADKAIAISLHDNLIRLRNWERELFVNGLTEFESSDQSLTREICGQMKKIGEIVGIIDVSLCEGDTDTAVSSVEELDTTIDELIENSEPALVALAVASRSGVEGLLMRTIEQRAGDLIEGANERPKAPVTERQVILERGCIDNVGDPRTLGPEINNRLDWRSELSTPLADRVDLNLNHEAQPVLEREPEDLGNARVFDAYQGHAHLPWYWSDENQRYYQQGLQNREWVRIWQNPQTPSSNAQTISDQPTQSMELDYQAPSSGLVDNATTVAQRTQGYENANNQGGRIRGTWTSKDHQSWESLDRSYYVRGVDFFAPGRMFSILFTEPASADTGWNNSCFSLVKYGEKVYAQIRRFIVVRQRHGFCYGCPVLTYRNRATTKPGVRAYEHAIVHTWGYAATPHPEEIGMDKEPIPVEAAEGVPALNPNSRINFGIHHPIQYNVKVKDLGMVPDYYVPRLLGYWQDEQQRGVLSDAADNPPLTPGNPMYGSQGTHGFYNLGEGGHTTQAGSAYSLTHSSDPGYGSRYEYPNYQYPPRK